MSKRFTPEELAAAKQRLNASPDRGTDEEYNDYITRLVKSRDEYVRRLEAAVRALLECERDRVAQMERYSSIIGEQSPQLAPARQLYMRAVELAREALEGGERGV